MIFCELKAFLKKDPKVYVETILKVFNKYNDLVVNAFRSDTGFVNSLDKACRSFINSNAVCKDNTSKSPELLAKFTDLLLKKSPKNPEEQEMDTLLNHVVCVLFFFLIKTLRNVFFIR